MIVIELPQPVVKRYSYLSPVNQSSNEHQPSNSHMNELVFSPISRMSRPPESIRIKRGGSTRNDVGFATACGLAEGTQDITAAATKINRTLIRPQSTTL